MRFGDVHLHLIGPEVPSLGDVVGADEDKDAGAGRDEKVELERSEDLYVGDKDEAKEYGVEEDKVVYGDGNAAKRRRRNGATTDLRHESSGSLTSSHVAATQVRTHRGLYHEVSHTLPAPCLVVAPNAGVAAFAEWVPTLRALAHAKPPAAVVITDFTEEAALMGASIIAEVVGTLCGGVADADGNKKDGDKRDKRDTSRPELRLLPVARNPFRQPLSSRGNDNALPTYSNGFTFGWVPRDGRS